jgi:hypothetical protein
MKDDLLALAAYFLIIPGCIVSGCWAIGSDYSVTWLRGAIFFLSLWAGLGGASILSVYANRS